MVLDLFTNRRGYTLVLHRLFEILPIQYGCGAYYYFKSIMEVHNNYICDHSKQNLYYSC